MSNFEVCFGAVFPLLVIMAIGFLSRKIGLVGAKDVEKMNAVMFRVFLPLLLFNQIYNSDLSSAVKPKLLIFAFCSVLAAFALSILLARIFIKNQAQRSVVIQGIYRSNFVIIGIPIVKSLIEGADLGAVSVMLALVVPTYNVLAVLILELYSEKHESIWHIISDIFKNPLIIGSVCGIALLVLGWRLPAPLESVISSMSGVGSPMMLFLLGAFFEFGRMRQHIFPLVFAVLGRLVLIPGIFLTLGALIGFRGVEFAGLIGVFASSTAVASFTMAQQMGGDAELAGDIVVVTSALCPLTLFCWSMLFKSLGMF